MHAISVNMAIAVVFGQLNRFRVLVIDELLTLLF